MLSSPHSRLTVFALFAVVAVLLLPLAACAPPPEPEPEPEPEREPVRVENAALGLAYMDLTDGWEVAENEGETLKLRRTDEAGAELRLEVEQEQRAGVNLVKQVNDWKAEYDSRPQGSFLGQAELKSQFGTTFTVRGRYEEEGQLWEERRILTLYPGANRTLSMIYRHAPPEGEPTPDEAKLAAQERANQMFAQMGLLEAYTPTSSE
jgi:hypothetical protein